MTTTNNITISFQIMQDSDDTTIMLSQFTYDPWEGLTQACQDVDQDLTGDEPQIPREKRIRRKAEPTKKTTRRNSAKSYVINKERTKGIRLIQIKVCDLTSEPSCSMVRESDVSSDNNNLVLSAQYVVTDPVDEIMDMTETVIRKICKKLCSDNF